MTKHAASLVLAAIAAINLSFQSTSWTSIFIAALLFFPVFLIKNKRITVYLLLFGTVFFVRTEWVEHTNISFLTGEENSIQGVLQDGPYRDGSIARFALKQDDGEVVNVNLYLHNKKDSAVISRLFPGRICTAAGELSAPSPASNFYGFDYRGYLKQHHIHWEIDISSIHDLQCGSRSLNIYYIVTAWRHKGILWIDKTFPDELKGLAAALIFGDRHLLAPDTEKHYQTLGLIHLLAVSGLHVGLISGIVYFLLLRAGMTREKGEWILLALLPLYIIVTGAAPSVIRAASIAVFYIMWKKTGKKSVDPFVVLMLFALLLLFLNPYYLSHIGFQLSFIISAAILLSWNMIKNKANWKAALYISSIAQISSLPVILFHFYEYSFFSIFLNLLFIPFVSLIILPGMFLLFILSFLQSGVFHFAAGLPAAVMAQVHELLGWLAEWNCFSLLVGRPSWLVMIMLSLSIYFALYRLDKYGMKKKLLLPAVLTIIVILLQLALPYLDKNGYVTILDVGQGDSIVIELPRRKAVYIIDGGGVPDFSEESWEQRKDPYDPGAKVVVPFLKARGIGRLDKAVITHGDVDHYGGMFTVFDEIAVKEVLYGRGDTFREGEKGLLQDIINKKIPLTWSETGDSWKQGESAFQVLLPRGNEPPGNERSIVLRAMMGNRSWLFTGDMEKKGEEKLLKAYPGLTADLLKVGHHGSRTSSSPDFIEQLDVKAAFISAGKCNRFGHPHEETLRTLEQAGAAVFRTDAGGAVQITFDDHNVLDIRQAVQGTPPGCTS